MTLTEKLSGLDYAKTVKNDLEHLYSEWYDLRLYSEQEIREVANENNFMVEFWGGKFRKKIKCKKFTLTN